MTLLKAIKGARHTGQLITWTRDDGTPQNLTGATLTGTIQATDGATRAIDGTLTVVTPASGIFSWAYGPADVGTAGEFLVIFKATYTEYDLSYAQYFKVEDALPLATFPFTYDLSTSTGKIRLEIGDTDNSEGAGVKPPGGANFSDAELAYFYSQEGSVLKAAAKACEVLARMWAGAGENVRIRDYSINTTEKARYYRELAADLRARAGDAYAGGVAPTVRSDGYSNNLNSQETSAGSEYWRERKTLKWR